MIESDITDAQDIKMNSLTVTGTLKVQISDSKNKLSCKKCSKEFSKHNNWKVHIRLHQKDKTVQQSKKKLIQQHSCKHCFWRFRRKYLLSSHERIHKNALKPSLCPVCGRLYSTYDIMMSHLKTLHKFNAFIKCIECPELFARRADYEEHKQTHMLKKPFQCSDCDQCFSTELELQKHMRFHMNSKPFECDSCPLKFATRNALVDHEAIHKAFQGSMPSNDANKTSIEMTSVKHNRRKMKLKPPSFNRVKQVNRHLSDVANNKRDFPTDHLLLKESGNKRYIESPDHIASYGHKPISFNSIQKLDEALNLGTDEETLVYTFKSDSDDRNMPPNVQIISNQLPLSVSSQLPQKNHVLSRDSLESETIGQPVFKDASSSQKDAGEKTGYQFKCSFCDMRFSRKFSKISHERIHTGEKPYTCDICNSSFRQSGTLALHKRSVHEKQKPFACPTCNKLFAYRSALKAHQRTHTKEKPFQCDICGSRFSDQGTYAKHSRVHTKEKPYECSICKRSFSQSANGLRHIKQVHTDYFVSLADVPKLLHKKKEEMKSNDVIGEIVIKIEDED